MHLPDAAASGVEEESQREAPLAPCRRFQGTGHPPTRHHHRGSDARGSIPPPRRSVRVLPPGAVDQGRAPLTRRRFAEVPAPYAPGGIGASPTDLHRRRVPVSTTALHPSRRSRRVAAMRSPDTRKVPPGRYQEEEARHSGTRKTSPYLARGRPSRSRSRSRRRTWWHRDSTTPATR